MGKDSRPAAPGKKINISYNILGARMPGALIFREKKEKKFCPQSNPSTKLTNFAGQTLFRNGAEKSACNFGGLLIYYS